MRSFNKRRNAAFHYLTAYVFFFSCTFSVAAQAETDAEKAQKYAIKLQASMNAIEDSDRDAPRDRWDPAYIIQIIGVEPAQLFAWVKNNITWEPYHGALRGPVGVLMDRRGNSLDSSLLAALLRQTGNVVRIAHATLTPTVVAEVWTRISSLQNPLPAEEDRGPISEEMALTAANLMSSSPDTLKTAETYDMDHAAIVETTKSSVTRGNSVASDLHKQTQAQSPRLLTAAGLASADQSKKALNTVTLDALGDHWWVQMKSGSSWTDFDLLASADKPGAAIAPAVNTSDPDQLADELKHTVTVRVVIEQWKEGRTAELVPLEQSFEPRDLIGTQIELLHSPALWPSDWPAVTPDDVQIKLRAAVYTQSEWLPVLLVGKQHFSRASIRDSGAVNEHPTAADPFRALSVTAVGQLQKAADILATGGDPNATLAPDTEAKKPNAPRADGELTAEWLEFEIHSPGSPPRKIRRQIFDILGPAARAGNGLGQFTISEEQKLARSTAVLEQTEMLIMPSALAPEYLVHLLALNALDNKDVLEEVSRDPFSKIPPNYVEIFSKMTSIPAALYAFAGMRFDANPEGANLFIDRPLVVLQHGGLARGKGGDFFVRYALDLVDNTIGVDPRTRAHPSELRLRQGVVDTNTEAAALRLTGQEVTQNTADAFGASIQAGKEWVTLKPGDEAKVETLKIPVDPAARIVADLKAGNIVVALSNPGPDERASWWRIDPVTGTTIGIGADGSGQALVEYALVIIIQGIINTAQCMLAGSATKAIEKSIAVLDENVAENKLNPAVGVLKSIGQGARAGYEQGKESAKKATEPGKRHHCFAMGMLGAFDAGLMIANFEFSKALVRKMRGAGSGMGAGSPGNEPGESTNKLNENNKPNENTNEAQKSAEKAQQEAKNAQESAKEAKESVEQAEKQRQEDLKKSDEKLKEREEALDKAEKEQQKNEQKKEEQTKEQQDEQKKFDDFIKRRDEYTKAREAETEARDAYNKYKNHNPPPKDVDVDQLKKNWENARDAETAAEYQLQVANAKMKGRPIPAPPVFEGGKVVAGDPNVGGQDVTEANKAAPQGKGDLPQTQDQIPAGGPAPAPQGNAAAGGSQALTVPKGPAVGPGPQGQVVAGDPNVSGVAGTQAGQAVKGQVVAGDPNVSGVAGTQPSQVVPPQKSPLATTVSMGELGSILKAF